MILMAWYIGRIFLWKKSNEDDLTEYKKGMVVKAVVLGIDMEKERIFLGYQATDR